MKIDAKLIGIRGQHKDDKKTVYISNSRNFFRYRKII